MGLFTKPRKLTKQEKRHAMYRDRFAVAAAPRDRLGHAQDYVRAVCADLEPAEALSIAQQLFDFAAKANGTHGQ